jgi:hypothetical protein
LSPLANHFSSIFQGQVPDYTHNLFTLFMLNLIPFRFLNSLPSNFRWPKITISRLATQNRKSNPHRQPPFPQQFPSYILTHILTHYRSFFASAKGSIRPIHSIGKYFKKTSFQTQKPALPPLKSRAPSAFPRS